MWWIRRGLGSGTKRWFLWVPVFQLAPIVLIPFFLYKTILMRYFVPLIISRIYPVIKIQPKRQQKFPPPKLKHTTPVSETHRETTAASGHQCSCEPSAPHKGSRKKKGEYELESLHLSYLNISKSSLNLSPGQPNLSVCFVALLFSPQSLP